MTAERKELSQLTIEQLNNLLYDLNRLKETLYETIQASDSCLTWEYYGRSSRKQLPSVYKEISEVRAELIRRGVKL